MPTCRLHSVWGKRHSAHCSLQLHFQTFPVCTETISRLLQRLPWECHRCWVHLLFFRDPLLIYLRRGFTCGGKNWTEEKWKHFQRSLSDMFGKTVYSNCLLLLIVELQKGEYYLNLSNPNLQGATRISSRCCYNIKYTFAAHLSKRCIAAVLKWLSLVAPYILITLKHQYCWFHSTAIWATREYVTLDDWWQKTEHQHVDSHGTVISWPLFGETLVDNMRWNIYLRNFGHFIFAQIAVVFCSYYK